MGEGFPHLEGPSGAQMKGERAQHFTCSIGRGSLPSAWARSYALRGPSGSSWSWGRRREDRREQERRAGGALQDQMSGKGAEGVCSAHSGMGSLLSSHDGSPPSKDHSRLHGSWDTGGRPERSGEAGRRGPPEQEKLERHGGRLPRPLGLGKPDELPGRSPALQSHCRPRGSCGHRRENREIRRGRWEGTSRTGGAEEERRAVTSPTWAPEACWTPMWGPPPSETRSRRHAWALLVLLSLSTPSTPDTQEIFQPCES